MNVYRKYCKKKENDKRRNSGISGRKKEHRKKKKNMGKKADYLSPLEFSKFCLMVEAKIITQVYVVLNAWKGNN